MEIRQDEPRRPKIKKTSEKLSVNEKTVPDSPPSAGTEPSLQINNSELTGKNLFEGGADDLVKGIILAEVLGKPLSRRNRR